VWHSQGTLQDNTNRDSGAVLELRDMVESSNGA
jgi:hypothetical protein